MTTPKTATTTTPPAPAKPDVSGWATAGNNVKMQTLDGMLFIAVDITNKAFDAVSKVTEKGNKTIASTLGNIGIPGTDLKLGMNIYGKPPVSAA